MSYQAPQTQAHFGSSSQSQDSLWRATPSPGRNKILKHGLPSQSAGISQNLTGFFDGDRLPMYKDKPYFAPRRTSPRRRWRLLLTLLGLCTLVYLLYHKAFFPAWGSYEVDVSEDRGAQLWKWTQSLNDPVRSKETADWAARREKVRDAFIVSWESYEQNAWGFDEYRPISGNKRNMVEGGMGWIIVDALDTMMIMNLTSQVRHARQWIQTSLQYNQDHDVNTFETTIRMLGGLLSAQYLSTQYPDLAPVSDDDIGAPGEDLYIEKATDLAGRLLGAFESPSGIPYASVNLNQSLGLRSHQDGGASSTAEATTLQLEFKYLAKLTGEAEYWKLVEKVMELVDGLEAEDGLVPIYIHPDSGQFQGNNVRLGSRGDSYYEYLIKQYLQTSQQEPMYKEMWDESMRGVRKHLIAFTRNAQLMVLGERPQGLSGRLSPKMDHLVCFMPGTIALAATGGRPLSEAQKSSGWTQWHEDEMLISRELMKTCWATYQFTKTKLAPEIMYFTLDDTPTMMGDKFPDPLTASGSSSSPHELQSISLPLTPLADGSEPWRKDMEVHPQDRHNLQRPETIESLFYMYRITGDELYREWGWEMFKAFVQHTAVVEQVGNRKGYLNDGGATTSQSGSSDLYRIKSFTSLSNADTIPPDTRDNMESFWMAETLKYFYLLFSDRDFISLEDHVFNTEAHPMPRFQLGGDLQTGWKRKPR